MREFIALLVHSLVTLVRLAKLGGLRSMVAESVLVRHQLLILNRSRKRAPNLRPADRIITGLCTLFMPPARFLRSAIVLKPSTLLYFSLSAEEAEVPYVVLISAPSSTWTEGTDKELINAVVVMKRRNSNRGCPRIAQQIALAFGVAIDKDVVRRILSVHYRPDSDSQGPSWLTHDRPIFEYWESSRLRRFLTLHFHIPLSNVSSVQFGASTSTRFYSGPRQT